MVSRIMRALHAILEAVDHILDVGGAIGRDLQPYWLKDWHVDMIVCILAAVFLFGCLRVALRIVEAVARKAGKLFVRIEGGCRLTRLMGCKIKRRYRQIGKRAGEIWILLTRWK